MQIHQFSKRKKLIIPLFKNRYIIQDGYDVKFDQLFKKNLKKPTLWPLSYGCSSTVSRLQSYYKKTIYLLPLSPQKFLVLTWWTSEGWKAESTLEPPTGFEPRTPGLGIQCPISQSRFKTPNLPIFFLWDFFCWKYI